VGSIFEGMLVPFKYVKTIFRSIGIASVFGFAPGLGTTASSLISYSTAKQASANPEEFGKGAYEGVVAPEVANNAVNGGAMIPGLSLGIPGNTDTAVFLVALMMYGIRPGRELLTTNTNLIYLMLASLVMVQFIYFVIVTGTANVLGKITTIPLGTMAPIVLIISLTGAYSVKGNIWDVVTAIVFGFIGYAMLKLKYPVVPFLMSIVLGPVIEGNYGRSIMISDGSYAIFYQSTLSKILIVLLIVSLFYPIITEKIRASRNRKNKMKNGNRKVERNHSQ
jgi:putative tricarboxylic transport membrane protein